MMNSKSHEGRLALVGLMVAVVVTSIGATPPLNPLVIRADQQRGTVPAECNDSLAPAPRVDVRQIPLPEPESGPVAPPSASLREALRGVQEALAKNDRASFDRELARVRALARDYPAGAEKRNADDLLTIYSDIERMWNAQYESPFFARNSGEYAIASRYPGWEDAVRRSILTDARGERFYPAGETREFIARAAALRLSRLGGSTPYPAPRPARQTSARPPAPATRTPSTSPSRSTPGTPRREATTSRSSGSSASRSSSAAARRKSTARTAETRVADTTPRTTRRPSRATTPPSTPPAASTPSSPAIATPAPSTAAGTPSDSSSVSERGATQPLAGGEVPTPFETAPDATTSSDTALTTDTAMTTDSATATAPSPAVDATATSTEAPAASRGRSVLLPLILILIGLGVLVVLFRMSN